MKPQMPFYLRVFTFSARKTAEHALFKDYKKAPPGLMPDGAFMNVILRQPLTLLRLQLL